jgi:hypothetical protein
MKIMAFEKMMTGLASTLMKMMQFFGGLQTGGGGGLTVTGKMMISNGLWEVEIK